MPARAVPPYPPADLGLRAVTRNEWIKVFMRVRAHPSVKLVGFAAAEFGNYEDGAEVRPGTVILSAVCGEMNARTVKMALAQLRDWGLLWRYVEGSKYGRRGVADCYRLTIPLDVLARVPMLTPDYEVPEQVTSDHLLAPEQVASDHEFPPDQVTSDHQFPVDNQAEHVTSDHEFPQEQVISDTGTGDLSDGTGDLRSPHLFRDLSKTYSPTTPLLTSPPVESNGDGQVKTGITFDESAGDTRTQYERQAADLAKWVQDHPESVMPT